MTSNPLDPVVVLRWLVTDVLTDAQLDHRVPGTGYTLREFPIPFEIGQRVEIPVHHDMWMRGARYGTVVSYHAGKPGFSDYYKVKLDHPDAKKLHKVSRLDWAYMKVLRRG